MLGVEQEDIQEMVDTQKLLIKTMIENTELYELNAKVASISLEKFMNEGFSRAEALQLVCASFTSGKK